ncbi:MAG TPA: response regulator transcription factor [Polyangia bacterium]|nr:response regulator transcription factor [Polyangia bacterium]
MDGAIRVLIADDSPLLREALRRFVSELSGVEVVGLSRDGVDAVALASKVRPDVVLIDSSMPGVDTLEATRQLKSWTPAPAVVVCAVEDPEDVRQAARTAGADALVRKRDLCRQLEGLLVALAPLRRRVGQG